MNFEPIGIHINGVVLLQFVVFTKAVQEIKPRRRVVTFNHRSLNQLLLSQKDARTYST